ncbi:expressed unknown protein [Seminavis robusta]|uniref:Uncharacterized protein n=1 Tax=Seminavis robusta TaxID=568900 RepID=A0A9N8HQB4_9STRA|nr:expressed unknown protein [Seminavis robusta]|eukprot:Sro1150_g246650.1 n/a (401) ;mRNA; r:17649-18851
MASTKTNGNFDASKVVQDLLGTVCKVPETPNGKIMDDLDTLKTAQMDLEHLLEVQEVLKDKIEAKKNQVEDLQVRVSPFLSFTNTNLLAHLVSFLDEEALWKLELVMPSCIKAPAFIAQWKYLDMSNPFSSNSIDSNARERSIRFVLASKYAQRMEESAKYHYNPRAHIQKQYPWPDKLYSREDFRNDFLGYDNGDEPPPALEFFVRVAYRESETDDDAPTACLLEGFLSDYSDLDPWDRDKYTIIELGDNDNTHVHMVCNDIGRLDDIENMGVNFSYNWRRKLQIDWPESEQKAYMKRVSLTVLACEPTSSNKSAEMGGPPLRSHLVVATRGFNKMAPGNVAIMPPRSYLAKARTANLLDCVNVGLKPSEEAGKLGFRIMVDWGTQEVFTRRKSIFDAY